MPTPIRSSTFASATLALLLSASALTAQERPRVAVLSFENNTTMWQEYLGAAVADQVTTDLVNTGRFSVIERQMIDAIIQEQGFQGTGMVDPEQVVEIGRLAGADYLVVGSITRFSIDTKSGGIGPLSASITTAESAINARAISTRTGEIVAAAEGSGSKRLGGISTPEGGFNQSTGWNPGLAQQAIEPAVEELVSTFAEREDAFEVPSEPLPPASPPAIVGQGSGGAVYIDQGENFDVQVGDRYAVLRVVDEIVDADGNVLDQVTERVGVIEVSRVLSQSSVADVVEGEAAEGDTLEALGGGIP